MPEKVISVRSGLVVIDLAGPEAWENRVRKRKKSLIYKFSFRTLITILVYSHIEESVVRTLRKKIGDKLRGKTYRKRVFLTRIDKTEVPHNHFR